MTLNLNLKQLRDLIEEIQAGGGDASMLRRELEEIAPDQNYRTRTHARRLRPNDDEEPTTAERLNYRVGELFNGSISNDLLDRIIDLDRNHSLKELKAMCVEAGLSTSGDKKELAAKLIAKGVPGTKLPQTLPQTGTCYQDAWRFIIREGEGELIHGSVVTIGKRIDHAWVETETGDIWEPESGEHQGSCYNGSAHQQLRTVVHRRGEGSIEIMEDYVNLNESRDWIGKPGQLVADLALPEIYLKPLRYEIIVFVRKERGGHDFTFRCKDYENTPHGWRFEKVVIDSSIKDQDKVELAKLTYHPEVMLANVGFMAIPAPEDADSSTRS